jgi:hypothetical protein
MCRKKFRSDSLCGHGIGSGGYSSLEMFNLSDQSTIPKTRIFTAGDVGALGRSDDGLGST